MALYSNGSISIEFDLFCGVRCYVALVIGVGKNENTPVFPTPHNFPSEALQELPQCGVLRPVL